MSTLATTTRAAEQMVDLSHYPIADVSKGSGAAFARRCAGEFLGSGLCALPGFLLPDALRTLAAEAGQLAPKAYFCASTHNVYLTQDDPGLPAGDVARRQQHTYAGSVAYDLMGEHSPLRLLYLWDPLKDFIGAVLGRNAFHRFADPLGACSINVFVDGGEHGWHFDESEFTVTLMLQAPESGGAFEYVPGIRGRRDEREILTDVLTGNAERVRKLPFTEGTLLIFGGRQTLHRVTRVRGKRPRLVPVLCYSEAPKATNSESVRRLFWGRAGPHP